ncbi:hypothetical protein HPP92_000352 [Vanilla planifolia]|uniref:CRIB domain-containing protein n=1 Tax=Vanilla planifolia TaxID=51239 RepID=A0A835RW26_VANPL|nr:hypothetical protein HPP92_000352 [Vanilla planifolia]
MVLKERMERLVMLPFSVGCVSQSSIAVANNNQAFIPEDGGKTRSSSGFLQLPKPSISAGFHRLVRGFKGLSTFFSIYKEEEEEEEDMEIGYPTDVQHVAHIGWDGFSMKNWEKAPDFLSLSSLSLKQLELTMASQPPSIAHEGNGMLASMEGIFCLLDTFCKACGILLFHGMFVSAFRTTNIVWVTLLESEVCGPQDEPR